MTMEWQREIRQRLAERGWEPAREAEIVEELALHAEQRYAELIDAGVAEPEARRRVLAELPVHEPQARDLSRVTPRAVEPLPPGGAWGQRLFGSLWADLRHAVRLLRAYPTVSAIVMLTLALGIGANVAIFSVANAVLLKPLPFTQPEQLVRVFMQNRLFSEGWQSLSVGDFLALRDESRAFSSIAVYGAPTDGFAYRGADRAEQVFGVMATADFFTVLGVKPLLGRTFQPGEDTSSAERVVVLSHRFWQQRLQGDPSVLDRAISMDGESWRVIGVMPPDFWYPRGTVAELWGNLRVSTPTRRGPWGLQGIARLRPGLSAAQVEADMARVAELQRQRFPGGPKDWTYLPRSMRDDLVGGLRTMLWVLVAAVAMVLLIACANVANLLLARATARESEMAVRAALGASRWRLVRQQLCESLLLAGLGGALGLVLGYWGLRTFLTLGASYLPVLRDLTVDVDLRVLTAAAFVTLGTGLLAGLAPALLMSRAHLPSAAIDAGRSITEGRARRRTRGALVVAEIAVSLVLLVCAGLLLRSLVALQRVDVGLRTDHIVTMSLSLPQARYSPTQVVALHDRLLGELRALPGVTQAGTTFGLPMGHLQDVCNFLPEHLTLAPGDQEPQAGFLRVGGDYFTMLGIPLIRGRLFDARDTADAPPVVVVNEAFARKHFAGRDPLTSPGIRIGGSGPYIPIVGIVGHVRYEGLQVEDEATMYATFPQDAMRHLSLVLHAPGDVASIAEAVRRVVARLDPELAVMDVRTLEDVRAEAVGSPRFRTALLGLFALTALVLALIGIYGVMAFSVTQRTREMGVRLALGGTMRDVVLLVLGQGARLALAGVAIGLVAAFAATRLLASLLFGVTTTDPLTFVAAPLLLVAVALLACYVPARRAARVDPTVTLREG